MFYLLIFIYLLILSGEANREIELRERMNYLFTRQMPTTTWALFQPMPGAMNSILFSQIGGRNQVTSAITTASCDLHQWETGIRIQELYHEPKHFSMGNANILSTYLPYGG